MNDEQLLYALRNRQTDAFRQVVEQHQERVINICYRFVHDRSEAEDLAQETFLEVYRSIAGFREQASLSTWIHRIAVTKSLDYIRMRSREKRGGKLGMLLRLDDNLASIPAPTEKEPDRVFQQQEHRQALQRALGALPTKQGIAFVLSKYDGISYQEIADILKTTVPSVESLIHRARKNLRKSLQVHYERTSRSGKQGARNGQF